MKRTELNLEVFREIMRANKENIKIIDVSKLAVDAALILQPKRITKPPKKERKIEPVKLHGLNGPGNVQKLGSEFKSDV